MEITVKDMGAAGKPGYVAKIVGSEKRFLNAKSCSGYGVSANDKTFEINEIS